MIKNFSKYLFSVLFFATLFFSCADKNKTAKSQSIDPMLSKQARLDSLFESPIIIDSRLKKENIDGVKFFKSYILSENIHFQYDPDSIIRFSSQKDDVVELLKNKYQEKIIFLRFTSNTISLRYGVHIGMSVDDFFSLMPEQELVDNAVIYDSDDVSIKFYFDTKTNTLKNVHYYRFID